MAATKRTKKPAKPPNRVKTGADVVEQVFAHYCVTQNYTNTARKFGMPVSTVFGLINNRAGGPEELERIRSATRADMIEEAFAQARKLLPVVSAATCGSKATSPTADASRAFEALVRAGHLMSPEAQDKDVAPPVINVFTGMKPPPELAQPAPVGETTTTTADAPKGDE